MTTTPIIHTKSFFYTLLAAFSLVLSWHIPPFSTLWTTLDETAFRTLHHSLVSYPSTQTFWAALNSRVGDWIGHSTCLVLFFSYLYSLPKGQRGRLLGGFLTFLVFLGLLQFVFNKTVLPRMFDIKRMSPSYVLGIEVNLSELFNYPNNKVYSLRSFPADHATTLFLASTFLWVNTTRWRGVVMGSLTCLLMMPRMIAGGHWLTDTVIGAGSITLFSSVLLFCVNWSGIFDRIRGKRLQAA